jgi:hypothetical protein
MALKTCEDYQLRAAMDQGQGYYRAITPERKEGIVKFYEQTALAMYKGYANRMAGFAEKGDTQQKRLATLFADAQKKEEQ